MALKKVTNSDGTTSFVMDTSNDPLSSAYGNVELSDADKQAAIGQINSTAFNGGTNTDTNLTLDTDGEILGSIGNGLGAIKDYAKPIADLAGGFAAIGGYNEAKKVNKAKIAEANANLRNANYNYENKVAFDNIWKNAGSGLGKVTVS